MSDQHGLKGPQAHDLPLEPETEKPTSAHKEHLFDQDHVAVDYSGAHAKLDPEEIKLVKRLDMLIMPTLWLMYVFNYLDRNAIALARLDHLEAELGLTSTQYQTCVMILFVGYLLGQIPSSE
jgi:hypothetical protein